MSTVPRMRRVDEVCDRFEAEWLDGRRPSLEAYLKSASAGERPDLFRALLDVELELRRGEQQRPRHNEYVRRFPEFHQEVIDAMGGEPTPPDADIEFAESPPADPPAGPAERIVMEVIAGPHTGQKFTFDKHDVFLVGRSARAHLQLAGDPHFSRFHFRLEINPPQCYLIDLGSRNGTFVNGAEVRECHLKSGDVISGGTTELKVISNSAEQTLMLPPKSSPRIIEQVAAAMQSPAPTDATAAMPVMPAAPAKSPDGAPHIPGYRIEAELGRGDLGIVYRAVQLSLGRTCALKVLRPAGSTNEKTLQLFVRECGILSQLNHAHIVHLLDQGTVNGALYLATEYVPTLRLDETLRNRPLKERVRVACGLILQVLSALQYAHNRSLVHRDIKPGNVLITRNGQTLAAKLADFGVAKQYTNSGFSQITRAGDVVGSLPYMPPEQFLNSREALPSCDLYAAGATLYHWLTGRTPHDFPPGRSQFLVVLEDAPIPISKRMPEIPPALAAVIDRSLAREPEKRFSSATQMRHAIKEALKG
jgi:pSer/pThr/pTyr-binding forkhead associated (FHA) protein